MQTLDKKQLDQFLAALSEDARVFVPADQNGLTQYVPYTLITQGQAQMVWNQNTTVAPKSIFLPQTEAIYAYKAQGKDLAIAQIPPDEQPQVVFAMRHCDVQAIVCLDKVFLDPRYVDAQYAQKREKTTVFALRCNAPKPTCFCTSMGVDPEKADASVADVEVYDLGEQFAMEALTDKGQAVLAKAGHLLREQTVQLPPVPERTLQVPTEGLPEKLSGLFDAPIWDNWMFKCLGCGTCTYICPTCHCFDLSNKQRGEVGVKLRTWDSCMFDEYTLMAGGHNPRPGKKERVRNRFLHKLEYFNERNGMFLCVGCGRCIKKCPMNIDITKFIKQVMTEEV